VLQHLKCGGKRDKCFIDVGDEPRKNYLLVSKGQRSKSQHFILTNGILTPADPRTRGNHPVVTEDGRHGYSFK